VHHVIIFIVAENSLNVVTFVPSLHVVPETELGQRILIFSEHSLKVH